MEVGSSALDEKSHIVFSVQSPVLDGRYEPDYDD